MGIGRAVLLWGCASSLALASGGAAGGRLVIRDGHSTLTPKQAERELGGEPIGLEVLGGSEVYEAALDADGYFVIEAPPGTYRLEYLRVGEKAEFIPPQELRIEEGALTCAGSLSVDTGHVENLGSNQQSSIQVTGDCDKLWPRLRRMHPQGTQRVAEATSGRAVLHPDEPELVERLAGILIEGSYGSVGAVRGNLEWDVWQAQDVPFGLYVTGGLGWVYRLNIGNLPFDQVALDATGGAGLMIFGAHAAGIAGYRQVTQFGATPGGIVLGGMVRLPLGPIGIGMRMEVLPATSYSFFVDLSPVWLAGVVL